jgi:hypothetical protein
LGAIAWCLGVLGASLAARSQATPKKTTTEAPTASAAAPSNSVPAWIEGFSAGFEPIVQTGGEITEPHRRPREDFSGWSPIGNGSGTRNVDHNVAPVAARTTSIKIPRDVEIPPWVDLSPSNSITPRQPELPGKAVHAQYLPGEEPARQDAAPATDGWSEFIAGPAQNRTTPSASLLQKGDFEKGSLWQPLPRAVPASRAMPASEATAQEAPEASEAFDKAIPLSPPL